MDSASAFAEAQWEASLAAGGGAFLGQLRVVEEAVGLAGLGGGVARGSVFGVVGAMIRARLRF